VRHRDYMGLALEEARLALELGEVPVGAILVRAGQVVARAHNLKETWRDPTAHAEILALKMGAEALGSWRLTGTTLYVTLEPCPMCAGALIQSRVDTLVYGSPDPKTGAVESVVNLVQHPSFNHQLEVIAGIREEECRELLQKFFQKLR
jgi:tRNA(adenine34) deaminase